MNKRIFALAMLFLVSLLAFATGGVSVKEASALEGSADVVSKPKTVTVQKGDYLDKLATDNGTTFLRLFFANSGISDPDLIFPGQELRIPDQAEALTSRVLPENIVVPVQPAIQVAPQPPAPHTVAAVSAPAPTATPVHVVVPTTGTSVWDQLAACESGGNWAINTGNGFYGGLQFTLSSWQAVGGGGYPHLASRTEQISRAQQLQAIQGWGAWPACSAKLGLL